MRWTIALGLVEHLECVCAEPAPKRLAANAELLGGGGRSDYPAPGDALKVALYERKGRDDVTVIAFQQRRLTREQLRASVRRLVGAAKMPTINIYASQEAYAACVRDRYGVIRGQAAPEDALACSARTVVRMDSTDPRVMYWGRAAPAE